MNDFGKLFSENWVPAMSPADEIFSELEKAQDEGEEKTKTDDKDPVGGKGGMDFGAIFSAVASYFGFGG